MCIKVSGEADTIPGYDDPPCAGDAVLLPVTTGVCTTYTEGHNNCSTPTDSLPTTGCPSVTGSPDAWFAVQMPASGLLTINFQTGSMGDPVAAIYSGTPTGCGGAGLSQLACDDDAGPGLLPYLYLNNPALAEQVLYIRVWALGAARGSFGLCASTPCLSGIVDPPLFDNPPCPMPASASSYVQVHADTCPVFSVYNISCADSTFSNNPVGMPVPQNCSPNYPLGAAQGRDVWIPLLLPVVPFSGYLDIAVQRGTVIDPDIALYRIPSPVDSNCGNGALYLLDTCMDRNGPGNMPYLHLPYGGASAMQGGDTILVRMWTRGGLWNGTWSMAARATDWPLQDICLVTVDSMTGKNLMIWEAPTSTAVDSLVIQRESIVPGNYTRLITVDAAAPTTYLDNGSNPQSSASRYGISIMDSCGQETSVGPTHRTMHLTATAASPGWTLTWNDYEGFPYSTVYILRGTLPSNLVVIDSVPAGQSVYLDTLPIIGGSFYSVQVNRASACNSLPAGSLYSRSNVVPVFTVDIPGRPVVGGLQVYPNPVSNQLEISFSQLVRAQTEIRILDFTGREAGVILRESLQPGMHHVSWDATSGNRSVANGIYFVRLESGGYSETKKIVVLKGN